MISSPCPTPSVTFLSSDWGKGEGPIEISEGELESRKTTPAPPLRSSH